MCPYYLLRIIYCYLLSTGNAYDGGLDMLVFEVFNSRRLPGEKFKAHSFTSTEHGAVLITPLYPRYEVTNVTSSFSCDPVWPDELVPHKQAAAQEVVQLRLVAAVAEEALRKLGQVAVRSQLARTLWQQEFELSRQNDKPGQWMPCQCCRGF